MTINRSWRMDPAHLDESVLALRATSGVLGRAGIRLLLEDGQRCQLINVQRGIVTTETSSPVVGMTLMGERTASFRAPGPLEAGLVRVAVVPAVDGPVVFVDERPVLAAAGANARSLPPRLLNLVAPLEKLEELVRMSDPDTVGHLAGLELNDSVAGELEAVPDLLARFGGLRSLRLSLFPKLRDLAALASLKSLTMLTLDRFEELEELGPLAGLGALTSLEIHRCRAVTDLRPLAKLQALRSLSVHGCKSLTDLGPLAHLGALTSLVVRRGGEIADLAPLTGLVHLTSLEVSGMTPSDLGPLSDLTALTRLSISDATSIAPLARLTHLTSLSLGDMSPVTELGPLASLTALRSLTLRNMPSVTNLRPLASLTGLTSLELQGCPAVSDLGAIGELGALTTLGIERCKATTLPSLAKLTRLKTLDLSVCGALTDVRALGTLPSLETLTLFGARSLTDISPLAHVKTLSTLSLSRCTALKDLSPIAKLEALTSLDISECKALDPSPVRALTSLRSLRLPGCNPFCRGAIGDVATLDLTRCPHKNEGARPPAPSMDDEDPAEPPHVAPAEPPPATVRARTTAEVVPELPTLKRKLRVELHDGKPRVVADDMDPGTTANVRPEANALLRWLVEEKQAALFTIGLHKHQAVESSDLAARFNVTTAFVSETLQSTTIVFKDESLEATRLRAKRHKRPSGRDISAERVKLAILKHLWTSPRLSDFELLGSLLRDDISLSTSHVQAYREWLNLGAGPNVAERLDDGLRKLAPCTWMRAPLVLLLEEAAQQAAQESRSAPATIDGPVRERERERERRAPGRERAGGAGGRFGLVPVGPDLPLPPGYRRIERPLFEHQRAALARIGEWFDGQEPGGIVCLPTGGGKTKTAVSFVVRNVLSRRRRCLWLAHREELLDQAYAAFLENAHEAPRSFTVGRWTSLVKDGGRADVLVASIPLLTHWKNADLRALRRSQGHDFDVVVVDECHHAAAPTWRDLIKRLRENHPTARVLGLSATPTRSDESEIRRLTELFGGIIHQEHAPTLIERGILSRPVINPVSTDIPFEAKDEEREAYAKFPDLPTSLVNRIAEDTARNKKIIETYLEKGRGPDNGWGPTLMFAATTKQGQTLHALLEENGVAVAQVYGDTPSTERARVVELFKDKKINVVINCGVFTEGTDLPAVETVFLGRPTRSRILFAQMVGRGMRGPLTGGSEQCRVVSFFDDVIGLVQEKLTSSFSDELEAHRALGLESIPEEEKRAAEAPLPDDEETREEALARDIEALRDLFQANGLLDDSAAPALPLLGWWEVRAGRVRRFLPCFRPGEKEDIEGWIATLATGGGAHFHLPSVPAEAFVHFARAARAPDASAPVWHDASAIDIGTPGTLDDVAAAFEPEKAEAPRQTAPPPPAEVVLEEEEGGIPPWLEYAMLASKPGDDNVLLNIGQAVSRASLTVAAELWTTARSLIGPSPDDEALGAFLTLARKRVQPPASTSEVELLLRTAFEQGAFPTPRVKPAPASTAAIRAFLRTQPKTEWRWVAKLLLDAEICEVPFDSERALFLALMAEAVRPATALSTSTSASFVEGAHR